MSEAEERGYIVFNPNDPADVERARREFFGTQPEPAEERVTRTRLGGCGHGLPMQVGGRCVACQLDQAIAERDNWQRAALKNQEGWLDAQAERDKLAEALRTVRAIDAEHPRGPTIRIARVIDDALSESDE